MKWLLLIVALTGCDRVVNQPRYWVSAVPEHATEAHEQVHDCKSTCSSQDLVVSRFISGSQTLCECKAVQ